MRVVSSSLIGGGWYGRRRIIDALDAVLQADGLITQKIALGGRYTILEYDAEDAFSGSAKSNGWHQLQHRFLSESHGQIDCCKDFLIARA
jgi:hypothetical protein